MVNFSGIVVVQIWLSLVGKRRGIRLKLTACLNMVGRLHFWGIFSGIRMVDPLVSEIHLEIKQIRKIIHPYSPNYPKTILNKNHHLNNCWIGLIANSWNSYWPRDRKGSRWHQYMRSWGTIKLQWDSNVKCHVFFTEFHFELIPQPQNERIFVQ